MFTEKKRSLLYNMLFQVKRSFHAVYNMRVRYNISYIIHIILNIYKDVFVARTYAYMYVYMFD